jgi:transcriptional antiterminator NusG
MLTEEPPINELDEPRKPDEESGDAPVESEASGPAEEAAPEAVQQPDYELVRAGMNWYVLRVASNKEARVRDALERKVKIEQFENRVGRILVPMQKEKRMRGGAARVYQRKLYPGYVFVEMATEPDGSIPENIWFLIKETSGVGDFIGSGGKPSPMPMRDVEKMLAVTLTPEEVPALANLNFKKGDRVKVREGPFENFEGVVDEINTQKGTVRVIVTIFGRATPIEIEYWQVEQL